MEPSIQKRASVQQLEFLACCMERFQTLALSRAKSCHEMEFSQRKWKEIAAGLNKINSQFSKTGRGWLRYWICLKSKVRKKYLNQKRYPGGPSLTPFDRRVLSILTDDEGNLLSVGVGSDVNGFMSNDPEPEDDNDNSTYSDADIKPVIISPIDSPAPDEPIKEDEESMGSSYLEEDPISIKGKTIEKLQAEILQFKLRRQKEMHDLEVEQLKERHRLEMDILELRKKKMIQELESIKKLTIRRRKFT